MQHKKRIAGIFLMLASAGIFIFTPNETTIPATITLLIVGIALVATERRSQTG